MITKFLARRRAKHYQRGQAEGFNFAAASLLRGCSPELVESCVYRREEDAPFSQGFDAGIYDALRAWSKAVTK